ncbi:hypothetical protein K466DRAFT_22360 [Polyporus arcularius HHB13444]|uniref:Uncharacterized protein n=1 Tax=Polyporus arcularius HHB13444 TaxID=1314778 RepID=A0A5C3Q6M0_9APHY|nr:hypothetical protein K466DRAFT_22360 [Polyporus arcularius HHB13444]
MRIACLGFVTLPFEGCVPATKRAGFRRIPEHMRTPFGGGTELRCLVNQLLVVLRDSTYGDGAVSRRRGSRRGFADCAVHRGVVSCFLFRRLLGFERESMAQEHEAAGVMRHCNCVSNGQLGKAVPIRGQIGSAKH